MRVGAGIIIVLGLAIASPSSASAQTTGEPNIIGAIEGIGGWAGFADDAIIHHSVIGVAAPLRVTPRLWVGPELLRMQGPRDDRDWVLSGTVWFDLLGPTGSSGGPRRLMPYVVGGGGLFGHSDRFGSTGEGYVGGGGGVRGYLTDRLYVAGEWQWGWELHVRTVARVGYRFTSGRTASQRTKVASGPS